MAKDFQNQVDETPPEESAHWNPMINAGFRADNLDRESNEGRSSSVRSFLMEYYDSKPSSQFVARTRAFLVVQLGQISSVVTTSATDKTPSYLLKKGGRFSITTNNWPKHQGHIYYLVDDKKDPGYFLMVSGEYQFSHWLDTASHWFVTNDVSVLQRLVDTLKLERSKIPPNSIFFGRGYVQHAGAAYNDYRNRYRGTVAFRWGP